MGEKMLENGLVNGMAVDDRPGESTTIAYPLPTYQCKATVRSVLPKARKPEESLLGAFCVWIVDHQIGIAVNLLLLLALAHISFPKARIHTHKFFTLSYYNPASGRYGIGWDDGCFVTFWIVIITGLRVAAMDYAFAPIAQMGGIHKRKDKIRFAEQAWIWIYTLMSWSLGMYIMYHSQYWLDLTYIWRLWPDREMDGLFKWYYLVQFAFWIQQILVVNIEERRKDHWQMFIHHLVTSILIFTSYGYHHYRIGNVILCLMDSVDTIFPLAKMLKYLNYQTACDLAFGAFVLDWFVTRHVLYMFVVRSIFYDLPDYIQPGCYSGSNRALKGPFPPPNNWEYLIGPFQSTTGVICQTDTMRNLFVGMLLFLQAILCMWFTMIVRVVIKVLSGHSAEDVRSDDEEEEEEETEAPGVQKVQLQGNYIEVTTDEPSVEMLSRASGKASPSNRFRRSPGNASGVSLPHDRKELLGRIGCDKGN